MTEVDGTVYAVRSSGSAPRAPRWLNVLRVDTGLGLDEHARHVIAGARSRALRLLVVALAGIVSVLGLESTPDGAAGAAITTAPSVTVVPGNGGVVVRHRSFALTVVLRNAGSSALPKGRLRVALDHEPQVDSQSLLSTIATPARRLQGYLVGAVHPTPPIPPSSTRTVRITVSANDLDSTLTPANGPRLLYTEYLSGREQVLTNSAVTQIDSKTKQTVNLVSVVPLLAPANELGVVTLQEQAVLTAPDGSWSAVLRAAIENPTVTIALDPEVIASIRLAGSSAPPSAIAFLDQLRALPNPFVALPYGDPDLGLSRAAGLNRQPSPTNLTKATDLLRASTTNTAAPPQTDTELSTLTDWNWSDLRIAWPVPGTLTTEDLAAARARRQQVLISSSDTVPAQSPSSQEPAAVVDATPALVADASISQLLGRANDSTPEGRSAQTLLTAALAAGTATHGTYLAVVGRDTATPDLAVVMNKLRRLNWIQSVALTDLRDTSRSALRLKKMQPSKASVATAKPVVQADSAVLRMRSAVIGQAPDVDAMRLRTIAALSASWRAQPALWRAAAATNAAQLSSFARSIAIENGAAINAIGSDGSLRVVVRNRLAEPIRVSVNAKTNNGKLHFQAPARIRVPAQGSASGVIKFNSISNGQSGITLALVTPSGTELSQTARRKVAVQAGLDTVVATLLLIALSLLLALGLYRNIKRRRLKRSTTTDA